MSSKQNNHENIQKLIMDLKKKAETKKDEKPSLLNLFKDVIEERAADKKHAEAEAAAKEQAHAETAQAKKPKKEAQTEQQTQEEDDTSLSFPEVLDVLTQLKDHYESWTNSIESIASRAKEKASEKGTAFEETAESVVNNRIDGLVEQSRDGGTSLFEIRDNWLEILTKHDESLDFSHIIQRAEEALEQIRYTRDKQKAMVQQYGYDMQNVHDAIDELNNEIQYSLKAEIESTEARFKTKAKMSTRDYHNFCYNYDLEMVRKADHFSVLRPGIAWGRDTGPFDKDRFKKCRDGVKAFMKKYGVSFEEMHDIHALWLSSKEQQEKLEYKIEKKNSEIQEQQQIISKYQGLDRYLVENKQTQIYKDFDEAFIAFLREQPAMKTFLLNDGDDESKSIATLKQQQEAFEGLYNDTHEAATGIRATYESLYSVVAQLDTLSKRINDQDYTLIPSDVLAVLTTEHDDLDAFYKAITDEREHHANVLNATIDYYAAAPQPEGVVLYADLKSEHEDFAVLNNLTSKSQPAIESAVNKLADIAHTIHRTLITHNNAPVAFKRAKQILAQK